MEKKREKISGDSLDIHDSIAIKKISAGIFSF